jgi:hypothetical protein
MIDAEDHKMTLMLMEYPLAADIDSIFASKAQNPDNTYDASVAGYTASKVAGSYSIGGATYYIRFNKMYVELVLNGFSGNGPIDAAAKTVIDWICAKGM